MVLEFINPTQEKLISLETKLVKTLLITNCKNTLDFATLEKLGSLEEVILINFDNSENIKNLGKLTICNNLEIGTTINKTLKISHLAKNQNSGLKFKIKVNSSNYIRNLKYFKYLKKLKLSHLSGVHNLFILNNLTRFESLHLKMLYDLKSLDGLEYLEHLKELEVDKCYKLEKINLKKIKINNKYLSIKL